MVAMSDASRAFLQQIIATDPLTDAAAGLRGPALGPKRLVIDGHEARRRIKADPALRLIPIFAVTSYALSGEEQKARAAGCSEGLQPAPTASENSSVFALGRRCRASLSKEFTR
jgi:CheY-like chemotaxis protein